MKTKLPISVIIPCYNSFETISRSISSILKQSHLPEEVILVDDCSDDANKTFNKIQDCLLSLRNKSIRTCFIQNKINLGPAASRNSALIEAKEKYVAFLDADDAWLKEKLLYQFNIMENNHEIFLSCHDSYLNNNCNDIITSRYIDENLEVIKLSLCKMFFKNFIQTRTVMIRNNKVKLFNKNLRYAEDYDLWLRLMINNHKIIYINKKLAFCLKKNLFYEGLSSHYLAFWISEMQVLFFNVIKLKKFYFLLPLILIFSFIKFILRIMKYKIFS